jgi:hypothetical protein
MTIAWMATSAATRYASTLYAVLITLSPLHTPGEPGLNGVLIRRRGGMREAAKTMEADLGVNAVGQPRVSEGAFGGS